MEKNDVAFGGLREPTDLTVDGRCSRCAGCCSSLIPLSPREILDLSLYAAEHGIEPEIPSKDDNVVYLQCPFLKRPSNVLERFSCLVYDKRPAVCRAFSCSNNNEQNARAYMDLTGETVMPAVVNAWTLFGKTGLRCQSIEVTTENAKRVELVDDAGHLHVVRMGMPLTLRLVSGRTIRNGMCVDMDKKALHVFDGDERTIGPVPYDEIEDIDETT